MISEILYQIINIYTYVIFAAVIVSWVAPQSRHPAVEFLRSVTEPVFAKVRAILPNMGGLDLSPMVVIVVLHFLKRFV